MNSIQNVYSNTDLQEICYEFYIPNQLRVFSCRTASNNNNMVEARICGMDATLALFSLGY
jgi:hypothetical protein